MAFILLGSIFLIDNRCIVPDEVYKILKTYGIENIRINSLGNYDDIEYEIEDVKVTENEIDAYIEMQLESFAEIIRVTDRDIVENGDVVYVSYIVWRDGSVINQVESDNLIVGSGMYDEFFEENLIGQRVGQPFSFNMQNPENNECVTVNVVVESINYFKTYELTDEFVKENFEMESVDEYYIDCQKKLYEEKEYMMKTEAERKLIERIIERSTFDIDKKEIASYCVNIVKEDNGAKILAERCEDIKSDKINDSVTSDKQSEACMKSEHLSNVIEVSNGYSDYYGGSYINEKEELVVLLKDDNEELIDYCVNTIGNDDVNYKKCNNSLEELENLKNTICDFHAENIDKLFPNNELNVLLKSIVAIGIYTDKNKVFVQIMECNEEKIRTFKKYISDSEFVIFEDSELLQNHSEDATTTTEDYILQPGEQIKMYAQGAYREWSIGFRCKRLNSNGSYAYGFVTAAHGTKNYSAVYTAGGNFIGNVFFRSYDNGGTVDAAFVYVSNSKYGCTRVIYGQKYNQYISSDCVTQYVQGATVYMAGGMSGIVEGVIESTSTYVVANVDGIYYKTYDVVKATYCAQGGDSGGLVYMNENGDKCVAGIHKASSGTRTFFVKVKNIKENLGVVLY